MGTEKRKFTRFYYNMNSEFIVNNVAYKLNELINLSVGGCLLPVAVKAKKDDDCMLKILLGEDEDSLAVEVEGKIVRVNEDTTAVNFIRIDPVNLGHLHNIVRYNSPDPDKTEHEIKEHPGIL